uniref:Uncharacterized protein n=1 Tax=Arundo donax TaxID=35708 RepID=A0A0A9H2R7_ARUDO
MMDDDLDVRMPLRVTTSSYQSCLRSFKTSHMFMFIEWYILDYALV